MLYFSCQASGGSLLFAIFNESCKFFLTRCRGGAFVNLSQNNEPVDIFLDPLSFEILLSPAGRVAPTRIDLHLIRVRNSRPPGARSRMIARM